MNKIYLNPTRAKPEDPDRAERAAAYREVAGWLPSGYILGQRELASIVDGLIKSRKEKQNEQGK